MKTSHTGSLRGSDVDVLVVLKGDIDYMAEVRRMLDLMTELLHRYDLVVSLQPATYVNEQHPLMMNVHREGAELA